MHLKIILLLTALLTGAFAITQANMKIVEYPDMDHPHSSWGSIGYSSKTNKVIIGVCDHSEAVAIMEWDCRTKKMTRRNWVATGGHLQKWQWQGKIHTQMNENHNDGWIYFGTDGGENREEFYMDHPRGYNGGYMMKYNPATFEMVNLGSAIRYESIKELVVDQKNDRLYGISYPADHFFIKDLKNDSIYDKGMINKAHVARTLFTDKWGNAYYTDIRSYLLKYEPARDTFIWSDDYIPVDSAKTPAWLRRDGIRGYAKDNKSGDYYFQTNFSRLLRITPQEKGLGAITDLGYLLDPSPEIPDTSIIMTSSPNLACGKNGKLYYWMGGHGHYLVKDSICLVECDPKSKTKRILFKRPKSEISEATGSNIADKEGNLYWAAYRSIPGKSTAESGNSRAIFIVFNPEKEVSK
ncbi:MAG: hypothetical protein V1913_15895 [Fibrobacterota bacterium]